MQDHGAEVSGKSVDQLLAEHDAIHDVVGPVRAGEPIPQVTQVAYQLQDCPDGNCPVRGPVATVVSGAVKTTGAIVHAVAPPYPRLASGYSEGYGSTGYSTASYGSGGGYSTTVYGGSLYGCTGYKSATFRGRPVRSFFRRMAGW